MRGRKTSQTTLLVFSWNFRSGQKHLLLFWPVCYNSLFSEYLVLQVPDMKENGTKTHSMPQQCHRHFSVSKYYKCARLYKIRLHSARLAAVFVQRPQPGNPRDLHLEWRRGRAETTLLCIWSAVSMLHIVPRTQITRSLSLSLEFFFSTPNIKTQLIWIRTILNVLEGKLPAYYPRSLIGWRPPGVDACSPVVVAPWQLPQGIGHGARLG